MRIKKILKQTPLETRLLVSNQMAFIELLTEFGVRQDKPWGKDEEELLSRINLLATKHTDLQIKKIKEWEFDGRPLKNK